MSIYLDHRQKNTLMKTFLPKTDIKLTWFDYANYAEYPQLWGEFKHNVTILDMLFNCGNNVNHFMRFLPQ